MGTELSASQILVRSEGALDDIHRAGHHVRAQAELAIVGGHPLGHLRTGEVQHPPDVGGSDEVPGRRKDVGPERFRDHAVPAA